MNDDLAQRAGVKREPIPIGSPFRGGANEGGLIGQGAVAAAAEAVEQSRLRLSDATTAAGATADPSSPPASAIKKQARISQSEVTPTPPPPSSSKKRKQLASGGGTGGSTGGMNTAEKEKNGKGLRHFSMKVCEKVEEKHKTTYNEVADELVAEFSKPDDPKFCADQAYDEKNIRRRVYDALNVLMAMDIITKEKKEITWKGLPQIAGGVGGGGVGGGGGGGGDAAEYEKLLAEKKRVQASIEKKNAHLQELVEQYKSYQALLRRNETRATRGETPNGIQLPLILVQTAPTATVEIEISEDQQLVHFDFNDAPFQIHDANYVLQQMALNEDGLSRLDLHRAEEGAEGGVGGGGGGGDAPAFAEIDGADFAAAAAAAAEVETETASPGEARRGTRGDDADDGGRGGGRSTRKK